MLESLQASHLQDLGTDVTSPLACVGKFNAAVVADAQVALLAEIATVKDQAQVFEAASALSFPQLLGPMGTFSFDLQQLILQLPVGQKREKTNDLNKTQSEMNMSSNGDTEVLTVSSFPLVSSTSHLSATLLESSLFHVPAEKRDSVHPQSSPLVP